MAAPKIPDDLHLLEGKKVIVGRMPLCVPNTYTVNLTYAGKHATVVSFTQSPAIARMGATMNRIPANMRATMQDASRGGKLTFRFEDGTVLDTCGDMMLGQLAPNLELAPGETIALPAASGVAAAAADPPGAPQQCPLIVTDLSSGLSQRHALVDALTTSELERQIDAAQNGGADKTYLDLRVRNDSQKTISAFEYAAVYRNSMGEETTSSTYVSQNTQSIKPGGFSKTYAMDRAERSENGAGDVKVYITRAHFNDNSLWEDNGSQSCSKTVATK
jgi:hypothetical protein